MEWDKDAYDHPNCFNIHWPRNEESGRKQKRYYLEVWLNIEWSTILR